MGKQQHRKRIVFKLAGSSFVRGTPKAPQAPPLNAKPKVEPELPSCPHGVRLTPQDFDLYCRVYGGRLFDLGNGEVGPRPYQARACVECHPVCDHGEGLTPEEITAAKNSGKRISGDSPVCIGSTDVKAWDRFLTGIGLGLWRGMAPADHFTTPDGGVITLNPQMTIAVGGYEELDAIDAHSPARNDVPARAKQRTRKDE